MAKRKKHSQITVGIFLATVRGIGENLLKGKLTDLQYIVTVLQQYGKGKFIGKHIALKSLNSRESIAKNIVGCSGVSWSAAEKLALKKGVNRPIVIYIPKPNTFLIEPE